VINVGDFSDQAACLQREWETGQRWTGIQREYSAEDVIRLRGPIAEDHAVARRGARRLWELLGRESAVQAFGAISGNQAVPMAQTGRQVIYLPGWPVATDGNPAAPACSGAVVPIVADAQAGFARQPDAFQLMTAMIEAGAAGVHFDDRLPSPTRYGRPGQEVLIPTGEHIKALSAARLAADVLNVPSLVIARTYAHQASLLTSDVDERDHEFLTGERTAEGLHRVQPGLYARVTRALAFAPYADLLWLETSTPNLAEARAFADIIYSQWPGKLLAYSCSPEFDWTTLDATSIAHFQGTLATMGYRFQFIPTTGLPAPDNSISVSRAPAGSKTRTHLAVSAV
jgi:isocitrate lyase